jgi:hypothetical protein
MTSRIAAAWKGLFSLDKAVDERPIIVPSTEAPLADERMLKLLFQSIWVDWEEVPGLKNDFYGALAALLPGLTYPQAIEQLEHLLRSKLGHEPRLLADFYRHKATAHISSTCYQTAGKENPNAVRWPDPSRDGGRPLDGEMAFARRRKCITKQTRIGSAGSCFAMEIKKHLIANGYNYVEPEKSAHGSANWGTQFNAVAFQQTVEWAFGLRERPLLIWDCPDFGYSAFWDPFREGITYATGEDVAKSLAIHRKHARSALEQCDYFVLTIGINEIWRLAFSDQVLARYPRNFSPYLVRNEVLTVQQNVDALQGALDVLKRFNPGIQLIVTVSPVPLMATFQAHDKHVLEANQHAKSVLRVAVEEFVRRNPESATYFAAFETVIWATDERWAPDCRHVSPKAVSNVMRLFEEVFLAEKSS